MVRGDDHHPFSLILAAADAADTSDAPPPPELELAWLCAKYHALPNAGGLLDQPAGLLPRMAHASFFHDAMLLQLRLSSADFRDSYPEHYKAWQFVTERRLEGGTDDGQ